MMYVLSSLIMTVLLIFILLPFGSKVSKQHGEESLLSNLTALVVAGGLLAVIGIVGPMSPLYAAMQEFGWLLSILILAVNIFSIAVIVIGLAERRKPAC